ncbi:hypothetical protein [Actinomadura xylanilytica]|uniref:hypothetical protein n=1 Tax=Actinomadura xylanilytica TaxID=887459 RepID=UPI00255B1FD9|nr:hypothetical protein [Actinomadura xylanilytica]MDL4771233.1 hypothetical protein [Actinomadura xylanilytica]
MDVSSADQWSYSGDLIGSGYRQHEYLWAVTLRGEDPSDKTWPGVVLKWTKGKTMLGEWPYTRRAVVVGTFVMTDPEGRVTEGSFPEASGKGEGGARSWSTTSGLCRYGEWTLSVSLTLKSAAYDTSTSGTIDIQVQREFKVTY